MPLNHGYGFAHLNGPTSLKPFVNTKEVPVIRHSALRGCFAGISWVGLASIAVLVVLASARPAQAAMCMGSTCEQDVDKPGGGGGHFGGHGHTGGWDIEPPGGWGGGHGYTGGW